MPKKTATKIESQGRQFIEAAQALGCHTDEAKFNAVLGKVARHMPD
jgi:hypothetical protein